MCRAMIDKPPSAAATTYELVEALTAATISTEAYRRWSDAQGEGSPQAQGALQDVADHAQRILDVALGGLKLQSAVVLVRAGG